jgi:hypothetical protein
MELTLVPPAGVRQAWPLILPSLQAVLSKTQDDWIPEDVYHALKSGEAACHLATGPQGFCGILVTTRTHTEFSGTTALHVWIVHNTGESDVLEAGLPMLREMAKKGGFARITFGSPRPGWAKRFPLVSATYEIPMETSP